jgi:hypothetical protein
LQERIEAFLSSEPLHAISLAGMEEQRRYVEVFNAAKFMEAKAKANHYTLGLHFWNQLVFGYVPAQILGRQFKESLQFSLPDDAESAGFEKSRGTCESGIAEAFMAFSYFGCLLFFVLGAFMRWLWDGAVNGSVLHQFLVMLCTLPAVMCFTVQLWTFVNMLFSITIFAGPFLWWSAISDTQQALGQSRERSNARPSPRRGVVRFSNQRSVRSLRSAKAKQGAASQPEAFLKEGPAHEGSHPI